jgi:Uma2 family endonuclease
MRGEVIAGRLTVMPRPAPAHAEVIAAVSTALRRRFHDGGDGATWWILPEVELSLGVDPDFDPVVPDLSGWRRSVVPRFPPGASVSVVPQWVCEVLSPRTARSDRDDKLPFYARAGVDHAWIIDPDAHTLEALRAREIRGARWVRGGPLGWCVWSPSRSSPSTSRPSGWDRLRALARVGCHPTLVVTPSMESPR